jgi:hypothetical protein
VSVEGIIRELEIVANAERTVLIKVRLDLFSAQRYGRSTIDPLIRIAVAEDRLVAAECTLAMWRQDLQDLSEAGR